MRTLILARHAHALSNVDAAVSGAPPGAGLSPEGVEQALALRAELAGTPVDLGACTELLRTRQTLLSALEPRAAPVTVLPELNEISFGSFEGGPLSAYHAWAWEHGPAESSPGGGESRADAALRFAAGLDQLLERPEPTVLAVAHAVPVRYIVDASEGRAPAARIEHVPHAVPFTLERAAVAAAAKMLRAWARAPYFLVTPFGG